jgi:hypothetical protein
MLYKLMCTLLRNLSNDTQFIEMSKLQNNEILDKIEELIEVMQNGFKTLYAAVWVLIILFCVGLGMGIVAAVIFLAK